MSKKQIDVYRTGIYLRLSQGDEDVDGLEKKESNSISNQKLLLEGFIDAHDDLKLVDIFIDAPDIIGLKQNPTKRASL